MSKKTIKINDFSMFVETMRPLSKITKSAKMTINEFGIKVNTKNEICRCEISSNSVYSDECFSFCVGDVGVFIKLLTSVESIHDGDFSDVSLFVDGSFFRIESKRLKTKLSMVNEEDIENYVDNGFKKSLSEVEYDYEIVTNSNMIKRLSSHSFMFSKVDSLRVFLASDESMNKNMIYSTIGCDDNDFENSATFEFGMVTGGDPGDSRLILNFERMNLINIIQSDEIKLRKVKDRNSIIELINKSGNNDSYLNMSIIFSTLVK